MAPPPAPRPMHCEEVFPSIHLLVQPTVDKRPPDALDSWIEGRLEAHSAKSCPTCCGTISPEWRWHCPCPPDPNLPMHKPRSPRGQRTAPTARRGSGGRLHGALGIREQGGGQWRGWEVGRHMSQGSRPRARASLPHQASLHLQKTNLKKKILRTQDDHRKTLNLTHGAPVRLYP